MTPADASALKALGLSKQAFATLTGEHCNTVKGWGNVRSGRGLQATPRWVRLLIDAWIYQPALLDAARENKSGEDADNH